MIPTILLQIAANNELITDNVAWLRTEYGVLGLVAGVAVLAVSGLAMFIINYLIKRVKTLETALNEAQINHNESVTNNGKENLKAIVDVTLVLEELSKQIK